ncbi:MAG: carboxyl-terminal processing protease [Parvicellaceae bacterium]|jgi:carboxyl-terminal processing protease
MREFIILLSICITSVTLFGQNSACNKLASLVVTFEGKHASPIGINNELSHRAYDLFLNQLDPSHLYFIKQDVDSLSKYRDLLDEEIISGNCHFLDSASFVYGRAIKKVRKIIIEILSDTIPYDATSKIVFNKKLPSKYAENPKALRARWSKWLRYSIADLIYETNDSESLNNRDSVIQFEKIAREIIKKRWICKFDEILHSKSSISESLSEKYLDVFAKCYDPHSSYYSIGKKDEFLDQLATENKTFGIDFYQNENGIFEVYDILPGGPAWESNQIHAEDVLVEIKPLNGKPLAMGCIDDDAIFNFLQQADVQEITIKLKKTSGQLISVHLKKEIVNNEDNVITSFVIEGQRKIGYISVPSFYSNRESSEHDGCANDVAKEILKLKKEEIQGLIFDLRFNGGGSLAEASELCGIFIDVGPVGVLGSERVKPYLMKDFHRGSVYSGPMIVLQNGASASASEMFSACMQDYNRALVVGNQSYGKATGQIVAPLDTNYWNSFAETNTDDITDFVKITLEKLYRINGDSHQGIGVKPDIKLPDLWESYFEKESEEAHFLSKDIITKKMYYTKWDSLPIEQLQEMSEVRIKQDTLFQRINSINDSISTIIDEELTIYLDNKRFFETMHEEDLNYEKFRQCSKYGKSAIKIVNHSYDVEVLKMDDYKRENNVRLAKSLTTDPQLVESFRIMLNLLDLK